ncbi:MAG: hypothetical protein ACR2HH_14870 [Chthoniobacterales bacterium]
MSEDDPAAIFAPRFNALGVPWAATGSIASIIYGEVRTTNDIDIVVLLDAKAGRAIEQVFSENEFYRPPSEVIETERRRDTRGHFNLIHFSSGYKADVYLHATDPLDAWAIRNRRTIDLVGGEKLYLMPPECVLVYKLEFFREGGSEKHIRDIRGMLAVTDVDRALIEREVRLRGLEEVWQQANSTP